MQRLGFGRPFGDGGSIEHGEQHGTAHGRSGSVRTVTATRYAVRLREDGPLAELPPSKRFEWLVAPPRTMIEPSEARKLMSADAVRSLEELTTQPVARPDA